MKLLFIITEKIAFVFQQSGLFKHMTALENITVTELKNECIDFIIVTHEMGFARHACDKAAFLSDGTLMEFGKSEDIFLSPKTDHLQKFLSRLLEWNM